MYETIQTVIIGGGQAGLSLSYFLTQQGHEHIILEQAAQPGEAWRNHRWDSFTLVTPNWTFRVPGIEYREEDPDGFMGRDLIVRRFEEMVTRYHLPVAFNTRASAVRPAGDGKGYIVTTPDKVYAARNVVIATGMFQKGRLPAFASQIPPSIHQLHSDEYRNPQALPPGAVLVVGAGQSGCQIVEELNEHGRTVYFSISGAPRLPRRYRGSDMYYWAVETGFVSRTPAQLPSSRARFAPNPQMTGKNGGHTINLHQFYKDGIRLAGHVRGFADGNLLFAPDLKESLAKTDKLEADFVAMVDRFIAQRGIDAPEETVPARREAYDAPEVQVLNLQKEGIGTILWASGYTPDYSMVALPVTDEDGLPITERGATRFPGLYFLGMPWLHTQKSGFLIGVGEDAEYMAHHLKKRNGGSG